MHISVAVMVNETQERLVRLDLTCLLTCLCMFVGRGIMMTRRRTLKAK